jgi:hypothetical protein
MRHSLDFLTVTASIELFLPCIKPGLLTWIFDFPHPWISAEICCVTNELLDKREHGHAARI